MTVLSLFRALKRRGRVAAFSGGVAALAACDYNPTAPPEVTVSFVTTDVFYMTIAGKEDDHAPVLRQRFYKEAEAFARDSGCLSYRVINETFTTTANIDPRMTVSPTWIFGNRPQYSGSVDCELPPGPGHARHSLAR